MERSPEVFQVLQAMDKTGVNVFVDVHGVMHEELPYNFIGRGSRRMSQLVFTPRGIAGSLSGCRLPCQFRHATNLWSRSRSTHRDKQGRLNSYVQQSNCHSI
jgi:hypothetical protein